MTIKNIPSLIYSPQRLLVIFLSIHLLAFSGLVRSASIFLQEPQNFGDSVDSYTPNEFAGKFRLTSAATVTGYQWWGLFGSQIVDADDIFDIRIYENSFTPELPDKLLREFLGVTATRNTTSLVDAFNEPVFRFDALSLSPLSLVANIAYSLSIERVDSNDAYFWLKSESDSPDSGSYFHQNTAPPTPGPWIEITGQNNLSFALVPEPSVPMLLSVAFLFLLSYRRFIKI